MDAAEQTFERLRKIARLYVGATSPGERASAMAAFQRLSAGTQWEGEHVERFAFQPRRILKGEVFYVERLRIRLHAEKRRRRWSACCSGAIALRTNWRCWLA